MLHFLESSLIAATMILSISLNSCCSKVEQQTTENPAHLIEQTTESSAANERRLGQDTILEDKSNALAPSATKHNSKKDHSNGNHQGTSPEDGAFGYDYWDSPDDLYEIERNQMDAWPDEW